MWIGVVFASVSLTELVVPAIVTISPFVVVVSVAVVWFDGILVALICADGVIVTKFRCKANCAAISSNFSLCRLKKLLIVFLSVFVSVFKAFCDQRVGRKGRKSSFWFQGHQNDKMVAFKLKSFQLMTN